MRTERPRRGRAPIVVSSGPFRAVVSRGAALWSMSVYDDTGGYDFQPDSFALFATRCLEMECAGFVDDAFGNHFVTRSTPVIEHPVIAQWHHVAVVYEPMGGGHYAEHLYVDGQRDAEVVEPIPMSWSTMVLHTVSISIGAGPEDSADAVFHGDLDELHLASEAWTGPRILAEQAYADDPALATVGAAECHRP